MQILRRSVKNLLCVVSFAFAMWALYGTINHILVLSLPLIEGAIYPVLINLIRCALFATGALLLYKERKSARWPYWLNVIFSTVVAGGAYAMYRFVASVPAKNLEKHSIAVKAMEELWVRPAVTYMLCSIVLAVLVHMTMKKLVRSNMRLNPDSSAAS